MSSLLTELSPEAKGVDVWNTFCKSNNLLRSSVYRGGNRRRNGDHNRRRRRSNHRHRAGGGDRNHRSRSRRGHRRTASRSSGAGAGGGGHPLDRTRHNHRRRSPSRVWRRKSQEDVGSVVSHESGGSSSLRVPNGNGYSAADHRTQSNGYSMSVARNTPPFSVSRGPSGLAQLKHSPDSFGDNYERKDSRPPLPNGNTGSNERDRVPLGPTMRYTPTFSSGDQPPPVRRGRGHVQQDESSSAKLPARSDGASVAQDHANQETSLPEGQSRGRADQDARAPVQGDIEREARYVPSTSAAKRGRGHTYQDDWSSPSRDLQGNAASHPPSEMSWSKLVSSGAPQKESYGGQLLSWTQQQERRGPGHLRPNTPQPVKRDREQRAPYTPQPSNRQHERRGRGHAPQSAARNGEQKPPVRPEPRGRVDATLSVSQTDHQRGGDRRPSNTPPPENRGRGHLAPDGSRIDQRGRDAWLSHAPPRGQRGRGHAGPYSPQPARRQDHQRAPFTPQPETRGRGTTGHGVPRSAWRTGDQRFSHVVQRDPAWQQFTGRRKSTGGQPDSAWPQPTGQRESAWPQPKQQRDVPRPQPTKQREPAGQRESEWPQLTKQRDSAGPQPTGQREPAGQRGSAWPQPTQKRETSEQNPAAQQRDGEQKPSVRRGLDQALQDAN